MSWEQEGEILQKFCFSKKKLYVFPDVKGAGASEAGGQTKEGALSKRYFQTSKSDQVTSANR